MADSFKFVDLFAGIGGFHAALSEMGGECVYAVENDPAAAAVYKRKWKMDAERDITGIAGDEIPPHALLAAGFPCQPFSKSGAQRGMNEARGTLFDDIARIIEKRNPAVVLLENVRNLAGPRHHDDWKTIVETLRGLGYRVAERPAVFSPHLLHPQLGGRPQVRQRVYITATRVYGGETVEAEPVTGPKPVAGWNPQSWDLARDLPLQPDKDVVAGCKLTDTELRWIDAWDEFVRVVGDPPPGRRLPGFPIWVDAWVHPRDLVIPEGTPPWKENFLRKNAEFYKAHQNALDGWIKDYKVLTFPQSRRKLEWQAQDAQSLWDCVMHLRPSGIRVKKATYLPALVAITQTSIIGPRKRRLSPREAARLQGLPDSFDFGEQPPTATYRQLGNAVNVGVVQHILIKHVERDKKILKKTSPDLHRAVLQFGEERDKAWPRDEENGVEVPD